MADKFISNDFMLQSVAARELYHDFAKDEPILDFHNHLPPDEIAENCSYENMSDIWLGGDHYKWRAMRANGISENQITGDASPREKFDAWAETVPHTLRNALYHWTHLELDRYFGYEKLFSPATADEVWEMGNAALATPEFSCQSLLERMKVSGLCTTDDPIDSLEHHQKIANDETINTKVFPTFRPDLAMKVEDAAGFNNYADQLGEVSGIDCASLKGFMEAIRKRHDFFHDIGARISDHGLYTLFETECSTSQAEVIFDKVRSGKAADAKEIDQFGNFMMLYFAELDAEKGWTKQFHIGVVRNNNSRLFEQVGPDAGGDSPADPSHLVSIQKYFNTLNNRGHLPKVIVYNLNPKDTFAISAMIGNFQEGKPGEPPCRMQLGTAWWFLDTKEGMEAQINAFSNNSLLSHFIGMLTDSRSFLSFTRHEYFRRILCNLIGEDIEKGEIPRDMDLVGGMVKRICYQNAADFLGLDLND